MSEEQSNSTFGKTTGAAADGAAARRPGRPAKTQLTLRLEPDEASFIDLYARERDIPKSTAIRMLLSETRRQLEATREASAGEIRPDEVTDQAEPVAVEVGEGEFRGHDDDADFETVYEDHPDEKDPTGGPGQAGEGPKDDDLEGALKGLDPMTRLYIRQLRDTLDNQREHLASQQEQIKMLTYEIGQLTSGVNTQAQQIALLREAKAEPKRRWWQRRGDA